MMDVTTVGELQLINSATMLSYVPICGKTGGYVTEEYGGEFKMREFTFSVNKFMLETLNIPPYFLNKEFCVVYGASVDKLVVDSYGGTTTELGYIKFTGESLDNLKALLQRIKKMVYIKCSKTGEDFEVALDQFFAENVLQITFQSKSNKKGDKYYACLFETKSAEYPQFTSKLRQEPIKVPANIIRIRSNPQDALIASSSSSPSSSAVFDHEDNDRSRTLTDDNRVEDYLF